MEYQDELERMKTRRLRQKQTESRRESESRYMGDNHPYDGQKRYQGDNRSYEWQNSSGDSLSYGRQDRRADNNHFYNERGSRPDSRRSYDRQNVNKPYGRSTLGMTESEAGRWYAKNGSGQGYPQRNRKSMAGSTKKKSRLKKKIRIFFLEVIFLFLLLGSVFFYIQKKTEKGVWTVAVFGVDSREGSLEKDTHSDVEMLCVLDRETGELRIVSVFRDTYLQVNSEGKYHKINQAYFDGGHTQAVEALNTNLDLQIDDYATFNWKAVADAITILGGIDLEITDSEFKYINGFITETVESTGLGSHHLEHAGMNHLDGVQAVAYARLRLMDTDYNRTARQRLVLSLAMEKAKQADLKTLTTVVNTVLPQISTSIGISDVLPLAKNIKKYHIGETGGFPFSRGETNIGKKDCVIPLTLESNVIQLHQLLYQDMEYTPSETVKAISSRIAADSGMGDVVENAPEIHVGGSGSSGVSNQTAAPSKSQMTETVSAASPEETPSEETVQASEAQTETGGEESEGEEMESTDETPEDQTESTVSYGPGMDKPGFDGGGFEHESDRNPFENNSGTEGSKANEMETNGMTGPGQPTQSANMQESTTQESSTIQESPMSATEQVFESSEE